MAYQGHLDWPRGRDLVGWVYDPAAPPGHRVRVEILLDGVMLRSRIASNFRPDLKQAGIGDGCHAFSIELPETIFDGLPHLIDCVIAGEVFQSVEYQSKFTGMIDAVSPLAVRCRIQDESQPGFAVVAELYADGRFLAHGLPPDLAVPRAFDIGKVKRLELRARGCLQCVAEWVAAERRAFVPVVAIEGPVDVVVSGPSITAMLRTLESISASSNETVMEVYADTAVDLTEAQQRLGFRLGPAPAASGHDVVYMAAGSLVYGSWLDRLRTAAYVDASIATVSPLVSGPIDGHTARELDALVLRKQLSSFAVIDKPSETCHYRRASGGSVHLLAGGVRVEALHPTLAPEDRDPAAGRLRRAVEELRLPARPSARVLPDSSVLVEGLRYWLSEDLEALARVVPHSFTVDTVVAPVELAGSSIPYVVEVKDYGWICPRGDLIDETGRYCGEPSIEACERCFRKLGPGDGLGGLLHRVGSVAELRAQSRKFLDGARLVRFPSQDAADRMARYCSPAAVEVAAAVSRSSSKIARGLRIRRLGEDTAIWRACVWDARKRELPLEFVTYGEAHAEWLSSESPVLAVPEFELYPIQFDIGAVAPGALRIPCGFQAGRINDLLLRGLAC